MKKTLTTFLSSALLFIISCGPSEKDIAIDNFLTQQHEIESIAEDYLSDVLLTYVEFKNDGTIDLSIVDPNKQKENGVVIFEYDLYGKALELEVVKSALTYASVSIEEMINYEQRLNNVNCISISRPFQNTEIEAEIGYKRSGWSKWYYYKLKDNVNINDYINKCTDCGYTKLNENWLLILESPR